MRQLSFLAAILAVAAPAASLAADRPNIVLIMADGLGYGDRCI